jgi:hypothetical protein
VLLRCLSKTPEGRYEDVASLEKALAACAAADGWSEEQARQWWKSRPSAPETAHALPAMATPRGV